MAKTVARTEDLFLLIPFLFSNEISFPQRSTDPLSFFFCEFPYFVAWGWRLVALGWWHLDEEP